MNNNANNRNGTTVSTDGAVLVYGLRSTEGVPTTAATVPGGQIDGGKVGIDGALYVRYI